MQPKYSNVFAKAVRCSEPNRYPDTVGFMRPLAVGAPPVLCKGRYDAADSMSLCRSLGACVNRKPSIPIAQIL